MRAITGIRRSISGSEAAILSRQTGQGEMRKLWLIMGLAVVFLRKWAQKVKKVIKKYG